MALAPCHECGKEISTEATACPSCGAKPKRPARTKWWLWGPLGLVVAFLAFGAIVGSSPDAMAKSEDRERIDYCWGETKDPTFDAGLSRFVAGACQKMESDFVAKWGHKP